MATLPGIFLTFAAVGLFVLVWIAAFLAYPFIRDAWYRRRHRAWWRRDAKP